MPILNDFQRDEQLAELLEELLERSRKGERGVYNKIVAQHPDFAQELQELWSAAALADDFGSEISRMSGTNVFPAADAPTSELVLSGSQDFGDYTLLGELGRGGMGVVYKARQKSLDRIVALKMILRGDLASSADVSRFRAEAEAAARLHHPNIVSVYEVGEKSGRPFFSMQYIEGTTLARRLADGPLSAREAAELLLPIARSIAEAHRLGILHRDLKPSNILIDQTGRPWVTDFGLAKRTDLGTDDATASLTQSGAILGTPSYMAPEQAAGQRGTVGPETDVYALGAILYAMMAGRPPFQASSPLDTVLMVLEQDPLPPRMLNPKADIDLEMIALKCLQKPVDLRYSSADALADDLQAWLSNEPIAARSSHFSQIVSRAFRETHHAAVLENWGLLWMWHSLVVLALCCTTNALQLQGIDTRWPYLALWSIGVGAWAMIFWELRRRAGPITFVERQIAHAWAGSTIACGLLFGVEGLLELPVLRLSPVLSLIAGNVFLVKAGILSGKFYVQSALLYLTAFVMAMLQQIPQFDFGLTVFGLVLGGSFFFPGLKYYRQRMIAARNATERA